MIASWDDTSTGTGTMVRASLWLVQEVGVGNIFTKEELRAAFPKVSQIDRRVRDLRKYGWDIETSSTNAILEPHEQRFARRGIDVWIPEKRAEADRNMKDHSAKKREEILANANYQCQICGIAGGQNYPDSPSEVAVLGVSNRKLAMLDGSTKQFQIAECKKCRSGEKRRTYSALETKALLEELNDADLARVLRWNRQGVRGATDVDRAWRSLQALPTEQRTKVLAMFDHSYG